MLAKLSLPPAPPQRPVPSSSDGEMKGGGAAGLPSRSTAQKKGVRPEKTTARSKLRDRKLCNGAKNTMSFIRMHAAVLRTESLQLAAMTGPPPQDLIDQLEFHAQAIKRLIELELQTLPEHDS